MPDDNDFSERYNSPLNSAQQQLFNSWLTNQSKSLGRDASKDLYDYDLQGWWLANQNANLKGSHLTDTYKKPNHPTFSNESMYDGLRPDDGGWDDRLKGGQWEKNGKKNTKGEDLYNFTPGVTNLQMYQPQELMDYFKQVEPDHSLILPGQ